MSTQQQTIERRALAWFASHDTGISSMTIARHMLGLPHENAFDISHPHDGGDMGRCLRLLAKIPEWEPRVPELAALSHCWAALVPQWSRLKALMIEETGPEFARYEPAPRTNALISLSLRMAMDWPARAAHRMGGPLQ